MMLRCSKQMLLRRLPARALSSSAAGEEGSERAASLGAYGAKRSRGSGKSLMGSVGRGALTAEQLAALEAGEFVADETLEAGDVLMEVLAEDHRHKLVHVEFTAGDDAGRADGDGDGDGDGDDERPELRGGPRLAHRQYLTAPGVGQGTVFERQAAAQKQRLSVAEAHAFDYQLPPEVKRQREHERRSRGRLKAHDVIENRIQEAMASGAFDDLPGHGKPLTREENPFEAISGDELAHRVLKNAGCAPPWVEKGKEIRENLLKARSNLALGWAAVRPPTSANPRPFLRPTLAQA
jgi:hypothetical protein